MKILVITHSYGLDGAAAILKSTMKYWSQSMHWEIDALVNDANFNLHGAELKGIGVNPIKGANLASGYSCVLINTLIDLPYVHQFYGKLPIILWAHEGNTFLQNYPHPPIELIKGFLKASLTIFPTPWQPKTVFKSFLQHVPKEKIACIPYGIDISNSSQEDKKNPNQINILTIGSVYPRKRQLDLANAVINLSKKYLITCTFVGDLNNANAYGPNFSKYLNQYPGTLIWTGGIKDRSALYDLISKADIGCFPSGDETFNISAIEVASQGVPVILSDLPVYNEVGWKDGVNCLKFPVGSIEHLEECIELLAADKILKAKIQKSGNALSKKYDFNDFLKKLTMHVTKLTP